jgi:DNA-3-methyladenine glycosylase II
MPSPHTARTRKPPYDADEAVAHLTAADPRLGRLIARAGPFTLKLAGRQSPFEALTEAIVYQQLHGKAAATIHRRMVESFASVCGLGPKGEPIHPSPQHILDCPNDQLRAAGLSANKQLALRDLAARTLGTADHAATVPTLAQIRRMSDEEIIERLTQVRGIGKWTVEMLLIFRLGRPDVLPADDYGVRKGFALTFLGLKPSDKVTPQNLATQAQIEQRAKRNHWHPWASVASWYLWRACDLAKPASTKA